MNPDKLFDYLDGKLTPADRDELEKRLANDSQLLRQLAIARDIHRNMQQSARGSLELVGPDPDLPGRSGKLGRRIATVAFALVVLNVALGIAFIAGKSRKTAGLPAQEAAIRQQLAASLGAAGANALPAPSFVEDEIRISAAREEWDTVANKIVAAAERCGGSAAKGLTEEASLTVVVDVPSARLSEFRRSVSPGATPAPSATPAHGASPDERTIVQVRIAEATR